MEAQIQGVAAPALRFFDRMGNLRYCAYRYPLVRRPVPVRLWIRQRRHAIALAAIVLLGLTLRVYEIGAKSFWFDETRSVWLSRQSIAAILRYVATEYNHPPLYFVLLHLWLPLANGDAGIRLFSALCSILNVPVIYLLGRRIAGKQLGLLAAFILAVSPFHVWYAQEARMYALLSLLTSLALYFLARLLSDPQARSVPVGYDLVACWRSWRAGRRGAQPSPSPEQKDGPRHIAFPTTDLSWLGLIVSSDAALLAHNTGVLLPMSTNLFVLGGYLIHLVRDAARSRASLPLRDGGTAPASALRSPRFLCNWLAAQVASLLLLAPYIPIFVRQCARVDASFWVAFPTGGTVYHAWRDLSSMCAPHHVPYTLVIPLLFGGLLVLGWLRLRRQPQWLAFLTLFALSPFVLEWLVSLRRPIFLTRTLIWASIPYYLLLAAGLLQLRRRALMMAAVSALVVTNAFSLRAYYEGYPKEQWREAVAYVCERASTDDLIILSASYTRTALDYYLQSCPRPPEYKAMNAKKQTLEALPDLISGRPRVWLVYAHDWYGDPQHRFAQALEQQMRLVSDQSFDLVRVLEYER